VLIALIVIWNLAVKEGWINHVYSATARQTFRQLGHLLTQSLFWSDLTVTLREALEGWAIGAALGLTIGLLLGRSLHAHRLFGPYLTFFNAIPKIALAPLFVLWFGVGEQSKVVMAILSVFFIVQVPTTAAVALVNPDLDPWPPPRAPTKSNASGTSTCPGRSPPYSLCAWAPSSLCSPWSSLNSWPPSAVWARVSSPAPTTSI
jgi:NitT/TauT family transport system permease protein